MFFSKSKYCGFYQCPKITWLKKFKPEEFVSDESALARMDSGNELGDLAMGLFGDFVEVTAYKDEKLDIPQMIEKTKEHIEKGTNVICEASFEFDGLYCAVDILKKEPNGYSIYEVKSSTHENNFIYMVDTSYQKYVLEKCGINVVSVNLVTVNNEYIFDGNLKLNELFKITNVDKFVSDEIDNVEKNLEEAIERKNIDNRIDKLVSIIDRYLDNNKNRYLTFLNKLEVLNPILTIKRGYSITKIDDVVISSVKKIKKKDVMTVELVDGSVIATVDEIKGK